MFIRRFFINLVLNNLKTQIMELKKVSSEVNQLMLDRCSVRKYDTNSTISKGDLKKIIQDALTAPSSLNLQPWHLVVVHSKDMKESIKPYLMFNKIQAETASAFIVIYANLDSTSNTDVVYNAAYEHGLLTETDKEKKLDRIKAYCALRSPQDSLTTAVFDCGLLTMQLMLAATAYGYDTNPIGGFEKNKVSEVLGVNLTKYKPLLLLSIGKADEIRHDSIRFSIDEVVDWK